MRLSFQILPTTLTNRQPRHSLEHDLFAVVRQGGDDTFLAVRRAVRNLVDCPAAVCSVCVLLLNKEEHPPPGYRVIRKASHVHLVLAWLREYCVPCCRRAVLARLERIPLVKCKWVGRTGAFGRLLICSKGKAVLLLA